MINRRFNHTWFVGETATPFTWQMFDDYGLARSDIETATFTLGNAETGDVIIDSQLCQSVEGGLLSYLPVAEDMAVPCRFLAQFTCTLVDTGYVLPTELIDGEIASLEERLVEIGGDGDSGGDGTLTSVASANGSVTVANGTGPAVDVSVTRGTGHNQTRHADDPTYSDARAPTAHGHSVGSVTGAVAESRAIATTGGLTGGGDLSADRTLSIVRGTAANETRHANDAAYTNARAPTGSAGGDLAGTYPNPTVISVPQVKSNLWSLPATPHANDQEFDSSSLPASWKLWNLTAGTDQTANILSGVDFVAGPATATCRIEANKTRKRSWLLIQPSQAAGASEPVWFYGFLINSLGNPHVFRARMKTLFPLSPVNNLGNIKLCCRQDSAGVPGSNRLDIGWEMDAGSAYYLFRQASNVGVMADVDSLPPTAVEVALVMQSATITHGFVSSEGGNAHLGIATGTLGTNVWVGFEFSTPATSGTQPPPIFGIDYFRQQDDLEYWG